MRSVPEYGGVIWSGAAVAHLLRLERLQRRFLMWLRWDRLAGSPCPPLEYASLTTSCPACVGKEREDSVSA